MYIIQCKEASSFLRPQKSELSATVPGYPMLSDDVGLLASLLYRILLCLNVHFPWLKGSSIKPSSLQSTRKRQNLALSQIHGRLHRITLQMLFFRFRIVNSSCICNSIQMKIPTSTSGNWRTNCGSPPVPQCLPPPLSECLL